MHSWKTESKGLVPQRINEIMMPIGAKIIGVHSNKDGTSLSYIYKNTATPDPKSMRHIAVFHANDNTTEARTGEDITTIGTARFFEMDYVVFEIHDIIDE